MYDWCRHWVWGQIGSVVVIAITVPDTEEVLDHWISVESLEFEPGQQPPGNESTCSYLLRFLGQWLSFVCVFGTSEGTDIFRQLCIRRDCNAILTAEEQGPPISIKATPVVLSLIRMPPRDTELRFSCLLLQEPVLERQVLLKGKTVYSSASSPRREQTAVP